MSSSGYRVRQAREYKGLTQAELAGKIQIKQPSVAQIEADLIAPSDQTLASISMQTGFPVAFFRESPRLEFPLPSHLLMRARKSFLVRDKKQAHRCAEIAFEAAHRIAPRLRMPQIQLPKNAVDPAQAAEDVRAAFGLSPDGPIPSLLLEAEKAGILIFSIPLPAKCDAFSCWVNADVRRPAIFLSNSLMGDRQNWTIAHEIGHLILHERPCGEGDVESEADRFAAELLMPIDAFLEELPRPLTLTNVSALKRRRFVSIQSIVRRAKELGQIDNDLYASLNIQINTRGWKKNEPHPITPVNPTLFPRMLEGAFGKPFDPRKAAQDLRLSPTHVAKLYSGFAESGVSSPIVQIAR